MCSSILKLTFTMLFVTSLKTNMAKRFMLNNQHCNYNRDFVSNFTLQMPNSVINLNCWTTKTLHVGLRAHLSFEFRPSKAKIYQNVFHHDLDYCTLFKSTRNTLIRRWYLSLLKKSNISTSCPVAPGYYYLRDWKVAGKVVPSFFPIGEYRVIGSFYYGTFREDNDKSILRCSVEGNLID